MLKDAIDLSALERVLVIKLRHHGDVLLTSPVFTVLKNHAPHLELDALVYRDTAEMLTLHPAIHEVHSVERGWKKLPPHRQFAAEAALLGTLRRRNYDLVIHLTGHSRGAWIRRLCGARLGVACARKKGRWWQTSFSHLYPLPRGNARHTVETHLDALRRIGVQPTEAEKRLVLVPGEAAEMRAAALLAEHGLEAGGFVHLHPTSRWAFKGWQADKFARLARALAAAGHAVALTCAPTDEERELARQIVRLAGVPLADLAGRTSLKELAAVSARASLFIGVDSVPMHIAAAMGTPTVALFGPSGDVEWGPWHVPHRVVASARHPCRPCGNDGCGGGKVSECLTTIEVEPVLDAALSLLGGR
jgi:heptosyltransferase-3